MNDISEKRTMKTLLIFSSQNPNGASSILANKLQLSLRSETTLLNVSSETKTDKILENDVILFLVATYGDQELQLDMEEFMLSIQGEMMGRKFLVIEIGNYYGYDDYAFGAGGIMNDLLLKLQAIKAYKGLSMDTTPLHDTRAFEKYVKQLNEKVYS